MNFDKLNDELSNSDGPLAELREEFEIDLKDDNYEKIVPVSPLGNSARFIHDFSAVCLLYYIGFSYSYI